VTVTFWANAATAVEMDNARIARDFMAEFLIK
jgi:hypothetical protein